MKLLIVGVVAIVGLLSLRGVIGLFSLEGVMLSLLVKEEVKHASDLEEMEVSNFREQLDAIDCMETDRRSATRAASAEQGDCRAVRKGRGGVESCAWALETRKAPVDHSHTGWFAGGWCFIWRWSWQGS